MNSGCKSQAEFAHPHSMAASDLCGCRITIRAWMDVPSSWMADGMPGLRGVLSGSGALPCQSQAPRLLLLLLLRLPHFSCVCLFILFCCFQRACGLANL